MANNVTRSMRILVFALVPVIVVCVTLLLKGGALRLISNLRNENPSMRAEQTLTFKQTAISDGVTAEGFRFSMYHYKSSDCVQISSETIFFTSSTLAKQEMTRRASKAYATLERGSQIDDTGSTLGERVVLQIGNDEDPKRHFLIVSTVDSDFVSINSSSLSHLLKFETAAKGINKQHTFPGIGSIRNITFQRIKLTEGWTPSGVRYKREEFQSSDCERLVTQMFYFDLPTNAQRELQGKLKNAIDVTESGTKSATNREISHRVVATFKAEPSSSHIESTVIMWIDGSVLHSIEGPYIYALEFESRLGSRQQN